MAQQKNKPLTAGASGTNINNVSGGALPVNLAQAKQLAEAILPTTEREPIDPALLSLLYFSDMTKRASQPGATALGSAGSAFATPAAYLLKDRELARKEDLATKTGRATLTASLASALKPKSGKPSAVNVGPAMENGKQKIDVKGNLLFKFNVYKADGTVEQTYEAPKSGGNVTNVKTVMGVEEKRELKWAEQKDKGTLGFYQGTGTGAERKPGITEQAIKSTDQLAKLETIQAFLTDPDVQTGAFQGAINEGKKLLSRIGFGDDKTLETIGKAENLSSLSSSMVLASVSQMKGALSDKELGFLQSMQANIGNTKIGNYLIILSAKHALQRNQEWSGFFSDFKAENEIDPDASPLSMGESIKENIKLAEKLKSKWQTYATTERDNLYEFIKKDSENFIQNLEDEGVDEDEIIKRYRNKYTFLNNSGKRVDAVKFVEGIFNRSMN